MFSDFRTYHADEWVCGVAGYEVSGVFGLLDEGLDRRPAYFCRFGGVGGGVDGGDTRGGGGEEGVLYLFKEKYD